MWRGSFLVMSWAATSLLGVAFLTKFVSSDIIFDAEGRPIKAGVPYYAIPTPSSTFRGRGINLGLYNGIPALVLAPNSENIPLIFTPWPTKEDGSLNADGFIETSQNLTISFGVTVSFVAMDAIWLVKEDPVHGPYVPIVPVEGSLDPKYFLFKIEPAHDLSRRAEYKFVSCAFPKCLDITSNNAEWLTLSADKDGHFDFFLEKYGDKLAELK